MSRDARVAPVLVGAVFLSALVVCRPGFAVDTSGTKGRVVSVTLYRGQAKVVRQIDVGDATGSVELVVTDLPERIISGSLFAEGAEGVDVRAVRHRARAMGEEPRDDVRALDDQIEALKDEIALNQQMSKLVEKQLAYLDSLEGFVAPTAQIELSKGVLDPEALKDVTEFVFQQREAVLRKQVEHSVKAHKLKEDVDLLTRKRGEISKGLSRVVHEAVLFLEKSRPGAASLRLNYLVDGCGWSPAYNLRAEEGKQALELEYNAVISQVSGEDWNGVELTLSTATPALSANGPALASFPVTLHPRDGQRAPQVAKDVTSVIRSLQRRQQSAVMSNTNAVSQTDNWRTSWSINSTANEFQLLELTCDSSALSTLRLDEGSADNGPSLTYQLGGTVSLPSRTDQQMLRILESELAAKLYHVATPVLTSYVYREAELTNSSGQDLLAGPVSVYLGRRFVGRTEIPTVARRQTFVVGLGADPQLRSSRELVEREHAAQGGNSEMTATYRLRIENYKEEAVRVRLQGRLPHTGDSNEIRITLLETTASLSEDPVYLRLDRPHGILRWEIDVAANATGANARSVEYGYKIEYDRNFVLGVPAEAQTQQLQEQFELLQQQKSRH